MTYKSEVTFPEVDWIWSDINNEEEALEEPNDFWDSCSPDLYDVDGNLKVYKFRPLIEIDTIYGVRYFDEDLDQYISRYFTDKNEAEDFAEEWM